jgi:hypothetical protein
MCRVLGDDTLREDLVRRGHKRVGAFSWASAAEATRAVYRQVIGG